MIAELDKVEHRRASRRRQAPGNGRARPPGGQTSVTVQRSKTHSELQFEFWGFAEQLDKPSLLIPARRQNQRGGRRRHRHFGQQQRALEAVDAGRRVEIRRPRHHRARDTRKEAHADKQLGILLDAQPEIKQFAGTAAHRDQLVVTDAQCRIVLAKHAHEPRVALIHELPRLDRRALGSHQRPFGAFADVTEQLHVVLFLPR